MRSHTWSILAVINWCFDCKITREKCQPCTTELCAGKQVVIFAVPGAFTPTCSLKHVPGFIKHADEMRDRGVDVIACVSVNDAFVMNGRDCLWWSGGLSIKQQHVYLRSLHFTHA